MKKRITAFFTAFLCLTAASTPVNAADTEIDLDVSFTITTDTFTYRSNDRYFNHSGFFLESELAEPDFMVIGMEYYSSAPEELYAYVVTPINDLLGGTGRMLVQTVNAELGDQKLEVGDLLMIDGLSESLAVYPTTYFPSIEGTMSYLGNGADIFGEEFERIIRLQMIIDQNAYDETTKMVYSNFEIIRGDVNVDDALSILDTLTINKNLLAGAPLCDYARLAADINENGAPDTDDSLAILKETLGITENFE